MMRDVAVFDASDYLTDPDVAAEYLNAVTEDGNPEVLLQAAADVAKANDIATGDRE